VISVFILGGIRETLSAAAKARGGCVSPPARAEIFFLGSTDGLVWGCVPLKSATVSHLTFHDSTFSGTVCLIIIFIYTLKL